jgi:hypothetical protein
MKKYIGFCVLFFLCVSFLSANPFDISFSIGSIGGGGNLSLNEKSDRGFLDGSIFDVYLLHKPSFIGLEISPICFSISTDADFSSFTFVNASLYHQTIRFTQDSYIGPYAKIHWIDLLNDMFMYEAGFRFVLRNEMEVDFFSKAVKYSRPFLFKYVEVHTGFQSANNSYSFVLGIKTDISFLLPLTMWTLYNAAGK